MYSSSKNQTANNLILNIKINGTNIDAILDTAAQVTLMNEYFANTLQPPVVLTDFLLLKGAGENNTIPARYAEQTKINIGKTETKWRVIVAKISDPVILGLDILKFLKATINLEAFTITVRGEEIPIDKVKSESEDFSVCRITLDETIVVPPKTTVKIPVTLPPIFENEVVIQPVKELKG